MFDSDDDLALLGTAGEGSAIYSTAGQQGLSAWYSRRGDPEALHIQPACA